MSDRGTIRNTNGTVNSCDVIKAFSRRDVEELYRFWAGKRGPQFPGTDEEAREAVLAWMSDLEVVEARVADLGRRMGVIFEHVLATDQGRQSISELGDSKELTYLSAYDLEAALTTLVRHGLLYAKGAKANEICRRPPQKQT